jgi:hypothetical protein
MEKGTLAEAIGDGTEHGGGGERRGRTAAREIEREGGLVKLFFIYLS